MISIKPRETKSAPRPKMTITTEYLRQVVAEIERRGISAREISEVTGKTAVLKKFKDKLSLAYGPYVTVNPGHLIPVVTKLLGWPEPESAYLEPMQPPQMSAPPPTGSIPTGGIDPMVVPPIPAAGEGTRARPRETSNDPKVRAAKAQLLEALADEHGITDTALRDPMRELLEAYVNDKKVR